MMGLEDKEAKAEKKAEKKAKDWIDTKEGKAGDELLEKALKIYGVDRKWLLKDPDGIEEWRYYPTGLDYRYSKLNPNVVVRLKTYEVNPENPTRRVVKYTEITDRPVVKFATQGGAIRFYYEGFEKHRAFKLVTKTQIDGIVTKKAKPVFS